ncbi:PREDICTED: uncharacterized protein LOC109482983 [Branchiostoma belcheri]|uniref:Uncharacterized protein LOC109482983 n=1 Tax=Branchiostoma belcheri TaxID=7741 RepID=A0A6P5A5D9_BRABE|nr:PREDICTED: uncharacterized protein LOC109482983 [Branchiostoma belcheri]XP_019641500.1 PREDICTED: uncharacterized protein LOC109482983 [Branchiostoma belcheri]
MPDKLNPVDGEGVPVPMFGRPKLDPIKAGQRHLNFPFIDPPRPIELDWSWRNQTRPWSNFAPPRPGASYSWPTEAPNPRLRPEHGNPRGPQWPPEDQWPAYQRHPAPTPHTARDPVPKIGEKNLPWPRSGVSWNAVTTGPGPYFGGTKVHDPEGDQLWWSLQPQSGWPKIPYPWFTGRPEHKSRAKLRSDVPEDYFAVLGRHKMSSHLINRFPWKAETVLYQTTKEGYSHPKVVAPRLTA